MLIEHGGKRPTVDETAYVSPAAVLCGDVSVGAGSRILHGAVLTAEDGPVRIGENVVVMENALVRGRASHPATVGDNVLIGPHAHVNGSTVASGCFIATGASLFPGSTIGADAEVRINGVVQVNTRLPAGSVVPISWVAVGDPAQLFSPDRHDEIWAVQRALGFAATVYGVGADATMAEIMRGQSRFYGSHRDDTVIED
jgi:carbonic anhydrase/acetyltransferase-like protein (isoleucine patch superfamily)